jgi:thiosulfate dehydrogenase
LEEELRTFIVGFVLGLVVLPVSAYLYIRAGRMPVATSAPPLPFERSLDETALHARIAKEMPTTVPIAADEANLAAGGRIYREHCAFCHGLPDHPSTAAAKGMYPGPPQLFIMTVTDDPPGHTFWKVANGIRLTGMPGFSASLTAEQMWQVSLLLANADKLSPAILAALKQ